MPDSSARRIVRLGVFYDGYYFSHVSNYYYYHHERRSRISLTGLHAFLREEVAKREGVEAKYCQIVEAHYFRGRLGAADAAERDILMKERQFEDVLVREGVAPHYVPLQLDSEGAPRRDKGIDVWFALEAYETALLKKLDVVVLVASDGDYVPLVRKLNTLGARVVVLGWDFRFSGQDNETRETRTSQALLNEASYPILMSQVIDDRGRKYDPLVKDLFVQKGPATPSATRIDDIPIPDEVATPGEVVSIQNGYGFIQPDDENEDDLFFFHLDIENADFNDLAVGDRVRYLKSTNDRGPCARRIYIIASNSPPSPSVSSETVSTHGMER
ncbi:MAG: NYN domain-containing protein [Planctomycetaceae bacterium]|nr:NYN domain-containing protein [Planctomycetaceae bacterium]